MQLAEPMIEDWRAFVTTAAIVEASLEAAAVTVQWSDGRRSPFHFAWLRDNCTCSACVHPVTREQVFEIADMPDDLVVREASVGGNGALQVQWSDGHRSAYAPGWLCAHAYDEKSREERRAARTVKIGAPDMRRRSPPSTGST